MSNKFNIIEALGCLSREKPHYMDRKSSILEPISPSFFGILVDLEDKFIKNETTMALIKELSLLYARLIEFYDHKKDPISLYFREKLEGLYSHRNTLTLICKKTHNTRKTIGSSFEFKDRLKEKVFSLESEINDFEALEEKNIVCKSLQQKKHEREAKTKIIIEMEKQKEKENEEKNALFGSFLEKCDRNDEVVKNDLKQQMRNIKEKIKKKSSNF